MGRREDGLPNPSTRTRFLLVLLAGSAAALAWMRLRTPPFVEGDAFGIGLKSGSDVTGDGIPDLLVVCQGGGPTGRNLEGRVLVYSGASWKRVYEFRGRGSSDHAGRGLGFAGDLDGDGVADLFVGSPGAALPDRGGAGSVIALSVRKEAILWEVHGMRPGEALGHRVGDGFDADGDGIPDLISSAPSCYSSFQDEERAGVVRAISGRTREVLWEFGGGEPGDGLGEYSLMVIPDGGTGFRSRVVVGRRGSRYSAGEVLVLSLKDGTEIARWREAKDRVSLGISLWPAGDLDGDGCGDWAMVDSVLRRPGADSIPFLRCVSGRSAEAIATIRGPDGDRGFGHRGCGLGDIDGDGTLDLAVGGSGRVYGVSGRTGAVLWSVSGPEGDGSFGSAIAPVPDTDGDGFDDLAVGSPRREVGGIKARGHVGIHSGKTGSLLRELD